MSEHYERITDDPKYDGRVRNSHEARYRLAEGYVSAGDDVLDACCGTGYGKPLLTRKEDVNYQGIDNNPLEGFGYYDFEKQEGDWPLNRRGNAMLPNVFVGLECIEHFHDEGVAHFVKLARENTANWIIISTPIVANTNPYHKQQFTEQDILDLFVETGWWHHYETFKQGKYGFFIFQRMGPNP